MLSSMVDRERQDDCIFGEPVHNNPNVVIGDPSEIVGDFGKEQEIHRDVRERLRGNGERLEKTGGLLRWLLGQLTYRT